MALIVEMGATAVRLAHYQHAQHFYDLCDRDGVVVWAEIPLVNAITASQAFTDNAHQQLTELDPPELQPSVDRVLERRQRAAQRRRADQRAAR